MDITNLPRSGSGELPQPATLILVGGLALAVFLGVAVVAYAGLAGDRLGALLAFPGALLLLLLFLFNREVLFLLVITFRSVMDPIFNTTKLEGMGLGGVLNAAIIAMAAVMILQRPQPALRILKKTWLPVIAITCVSALFAPEPGSAVRIILTLLSYAAVFLIPFTIVNNRQDYWFWMRAILLSSLIPVLFGFYEFLSGGGQAEDGAIRIKSTFTHPNIYAFYLVLLISIAFHLTRSSLVRLSRTTALLLLLLALAFLAALLLTKTRSAWAGCGVFLLAYGFLYDRRILLLAGLLPLAALAIPDIRDRILDLGSGNEYVQYAKLNSYAWRKLLWQSALDWMAPSKYPLGYGIGSFVYYSPSFFPLAGKVNFGAHSLYVQLFFETGFLGIGALLWLLYSVARTLMPLRSADRITWFTMLLALSEYAVFAYSDNLLDYLVFNWYFWFAMGLACAISNLPAPKAGLPAV